MFSDTDIRVAFSTGQLCNKGSANEVQTPHEGQNPRKRLDELVAVYPGWAGTRCAPIRSVLEAK